MLPERMENGKLPAYAWPGGYPLFYVCADNGVLCPSCANRENGSIADTDRKKQDDPQWLIVDSSVNWEDDSLFCDHCNARIESAYGEEEIEQ